MEYHIIDMAVCLIRNGPVSARFQSRVEQPSYTFLTSPSLVRLVGEIPLPSTWGGIP